MPKIGIPKTRSQLRTRRHLRVRKNVAGTAERPRLVVFRSLKHITAQIVDDTQGRTILTVTDNAFTGKKSEKSTQVGKLLAERARAAGSSKNMAENQGTNSTPGGGQRGPGGPGGGRGPGGPGRGPGGPGRGPG